MLLSTLGARRVLRNACTGLRLEFESLYSKDTSRSRMAAAPWSMDMVRRPLAEL